MVGQRLNLGTLCCRGVALALLPVAALSHAQDRARGTTIGTVSGTTPGTTRVAAGLQVSVRLSQNLNSRTSAEGDQWSGVLARDLVVGGHLLTPTGTQVNGVVTKAISASRAHGMGTLAVKLTSIHGIGVDSTPVTRVGVNPALRVAGTMANAGIPGEANPNPAADAAGGQNGQQLSEARLSTGAILTFTTD